MGMMMPPGGPPQGAPQGPPPPQAGPQPGQPQSPYPSQGDPAGQLFAKACEIIAAGIAAEPDPSMKAMAAKVLASCHSLVQGVEKGHDAALGLSPAMKFIQRQNAQQQGS